MMALIFIFSSIPASKMPNFGTFDFSIKKLGHMMGYALLAPAYLRGVGKKGTTELALAWLMAFLYAFTDETHQAFVPGRSSSIVDVGIDGLGSLAGLSLLVLSTLRTPGRNPRFPPRT
jgi:VanZ family protein